MCDCVIAAGYVGLHLLQSRLRHHTPQRGVYPYDLPPLPRFPPCQPAGHPVVESAQHPPNEGGYHPSLQPVQHYRLDQRQAYLTNPFRADTANCMYPTIKSIISCFKQSNGPVHCDQNYDPLRSLNSGIDVPISGRNIDNRTGMNP